MSVLVKPLHKLIKRSDKNLNFSHYGKAHKYICGVQVSGHYVSQGRQNRGSNRGYKMDFNMSLNYISNDFTVRKFFSFQCTNTRL